MKSNVAIIEPSSAGIKLIDASLNLENNVIVLTSNTNDRVIPVKYKKICKIVEVDTNDEMALRNKLNTLNVENKINAILPGFEYYVPTSARLSHYFGLKGLPVSTVDAMRFKHKMREHLVNSGIRMPQFHVIQSLDDVRKLRNKILFPCVVKPSHLAGSLYIRKIYSFDELQKYLCILLQDQYQDMGYSMQGDILIEEYISGRELSVEGYVNNGRINYVSITDKYLGAEPYFVEIGHIVKANISAEVENDLLDYTSSVIKALGINVGAFHAEIRLANGEPVLIEIAARLVGDCISELIELSTGISLSEKMVETYLGQSVENKTLSEFKRYSGVRFIYGRAGNIFTGLMGQDEIHEMTGFYQLRSLLQEGDVIQPFIDYRGRIAEIIFYGESHAEVESRLNSASQKLNILTRKANE